MKLKIFTFGLKYLTCAVIPSGLRRCINHLLTYLLAYESGETVYTVMTHAQTGWTLSCICPRTAAAIKLARLWICWD